MYTIPYHTIHYHTTYHIPHTIYHIPYHTLGYARMHGHTDAETERHMDAQTHRGTDAPTHGCRKAQVKNQNFGPGPPNPLYIMRYLEI